MSTAALCLVVGGLIGFYVRYLSEDTRASGSGRVGGQARRAMGESPGVGGMGGIGGGPSLPSMELARLVRGLSTLQKVQGRGVTAGQARVLLPLLKRLASADRIREGDAAAQADAIKGVLSESTRQALVDLQPQRGRLDGWPLWPGGPPTAGPGGPGFGSPGLTSAPMPGAGRPASGPGRPGAVPVSGPGWGPPDPERPFASERNRQALDDLIGELEARAR